MTKRVFQDAQVIIDSTDLSDFVTEVSIDDGRSEVDVSVVGDDSKQFLAGQRDTTIDITFLQDYDSGSVDSVLDPIISTPGGKSVDVEIVPDSKKAVGNNNPRYTMLSIGTSRSNPVGGSVDDAQSTSVTFRPDATQNGKLNREVV